MMFMYGTISLFFFSSRRRHTRFDCDWSSDVCSSDLVAYTPDAKFLPAELAQRLDRILDCAQRLVQIVPEPLLDWSPPERARPLRDLAYHVFRLSLGFVDGMDLGEFPEGWLGERAPAELRDGAAIARYGALVRARIAGWFEGAASGEFERVIRVYYGPQSGHDLLERTTWPDCGP